MQEFLKEYSAGGKPKNKDSSNPSAITVCFMEALNQ